MEQISSILCSHFGHNLQTKRKQIVGMISVNETVSKWREFANLEDGKHEGF